MKPKVLGEAVLPACLIKVPCGGLKSAGKHLSISEAISPLKVAGEEHRATAVVLRRQAEANEAKNVNSLHLVTHKHPGKTA